MFRLRVAAAYLLLSIGSYSASAAQTLLYLNSQPGDYIGQGIQQTLTPADGTFSVQTSSNGEATSAAESRRDPQCAAYRTGLFRSRG